MGNTKTFSQADADRLIALRDVRVCVGRELDWRHLTGVTDDELVACYLPEMLKLAHVDGQPVFRRSEAEQILRDALQAACPTNRRPHAVDG